MSRGCLTFRSQTLDVLGAEDIQPEVLVDELLVLAGPLQKHSLGDAIPLRWLFPTEVLLCPCEAYFVCDYHFGPVVGEKGRRFLTKIV